MIGHKFDKLWVTGAVSAGPAASLVLLPRECFAIQLVLWKIFCLAGA
jgi:hypothetical protein